MSNLTNFGELQLVNWFRGESLTPPSGWYLALASAASDGSITELSGAGYARQVVDRTLTDWAGTQGAGTTLASSGASHSTSNNGLVDFGTAGAAWGTANAVVLMSEMSGGDAWAWAPITPGLVIDNGDPVEFAPGSITFTLGLTGGLSDYASNRVIDLLFRGVSWDWPADYWLAYARTTPTNSAPGSEPVGGGYARQSIPRDTGEWTSAVDGRTSNANEVAWAVPTAAQGTITHAQIMDSSGVGNMLFWAAMASPKTLTPGGLAPRFEPDTLGVTFA